MLKKRTDIRPSKTTDRDSLRKASYELVFGLNEGFQRRLWVPEQTRDHFVVVSHLAPNEDTGIRIRIPFGLADDTRDARPGPDLEMRPRTFDKFDALTSREVLASGDASHYLCVHHSSMRSNETKINYGQREKVSQQSKGDSQQNSGQWTLASSSG